MTYSRAYKTALIFSRRSSDCDVFSLEMCTENYSFDAIEDYVCEIRSAIGDYELNELLEKSQRMLTETNELRRETESMKNRFSEADRCMQWTENRLEDIRRRHNRSAVIIWNFPDDLHRSLVQSAPQQTKTDAVFEFLASTVGVPDEISKLISLEHVRVFYTVFKSERSANVRIQFSDDDSKSLCEAYCVPFLNTFNATRQLPTRWKDDQTESQRDEEKEKQKQRQKVVKNGPLFTKFIQWPPQHKRNVD